MAGRKVIQLYEQHAAEWDAEFRRIGGRFAERMQCRRGCSMCCSQMFSISTLEAVRIAQAVAELPAPRREHLRARARAYVEQAASLGLEGSDEDSLTPRVGARIPCPALDQDACTIYAARPLICRKWGIPVFDPSKPDRLHACELNFREGESLEAGDLVDAQAALLERWVGLKHEARDTFPGPWRTMTIAEAILSEALPTP